MSDDSNFWNYLGKVEASGSVLWIVYGDAAATNKRLQRYRLSGPPNALTLVAVGSPIVIPDTHTVMTIAASPLSQTVCYLGITVSSGNNVRLFRADAIAGTLTEVWSIASGNSFIAHIYMVSDSEYTFLVRNDVVNLAQSVYYSPDGTTINNAGGGSSVPRDVFAIAVRKSGTNRDIYVQHDNSFPAAAASVVSHSTDFGSSWSDIAGTALNNFATGDYGYLSLIPDGDGSTRIYYSNANGGGGIQTPFIEGGSVTLNPQDTDILDASFNESGFYLHPERRIIIARGKTWTSQDKGNSWQEVTHIGVDYITQCRLHRGMSLLPTKDWVAVAVSSSQSLYVSTNYAVSWQTLALPNYGHAVAFVGGRN